MRGNQCELRVLEGTEEEVRQYTAAVNAGWTTQHLFTGSIPMRPVDVAESWDREREIGSIEFGVWCNRLEKEGHRWKCCGGKFIGTTGLYSKRDIYRSWEFRIIIFDPEHVSLGIGPEATSMVVSYAFHRLNAHRVWLGVNAANERAIKCYQKVGFVEEGRQREAIWAMGEYHDAVLMGVLRNEWPGLTEDTAAEPAENTSLPPS